MTSITGHLSPEAAAVWQPLLARFAAPGMCNPADEHPCTSGTPSQAQIDGDHRSPAQRCHDAMIAIGRIALMTDLGQLNGLPVSVIIRTTLQDLESRAGIGVSAGGTKLPIKDVLRMAAHAHHHLAIFDKSTGAALNYFRARRTASPAQRIMLIARDGGCTNPCCATGGYHCQAHHDPAYAHGGHTNVDTMALACTGDHHLIDNTNPHSWSTHIDEHHIVHWHPPPHLDHGQATINFHHRPELLLNPQHTPRETDWTNTDLLGEGPDRLGDDRDYVGEDPDYFRDDLDDAHAARLHAHARQTITDPDFWLLTDHAHGDTGLRSP